MESSNAERTYSTAEIMSYLAQRMATKVADANASQAREIHRLKAEHDRKLAYLLARRDADA